MITYFFVISLLELPFYARFIHLITRNLDYEDDRGKFARRLLTELECMWIFLYEKKKRG